MPKDTKTNNYLIQTPKDETLSSGQRAKLQSALDKIGVPTKDWRFVVLDNQTWKDMTSSGLPHPTDTTFSNLAGHVTYIHQSLLQQPDDEVTRLMAHEQGHERLNTTSEDKANEYARNALAEIKKYGRSNNAVNQTLQAQVASDRNKIQPTPAPIQTQLQAPSNPYQQMIDNENAKQQSKLFWDTNVSHPLPYQPPSSLPLDVVMHN